jgi:hypothetical protein
VNITVTNVNDQPISNTLNIAPGAINENDSAVLNGSFSDADGGDSHTVVITWGDGSPNTTLNLAAGVFSFTATHQYKDDNPTATAADVNTVTVSVCDGGQDGNPTTSKHYDNSKKPRTGDHQCKRTRYTAASGQLDYRERKLHGRRNAGYSHLFCELG